MTWDFRQIGERIQFGKIGKDPYSGRPELPWNYLPFCTSQLNPSSIVRRNPELQQRYLKDSIRRGLGGAEKLIEPLCPGYVETHYVKDTFDCRHIQSRQQTMDRIPLGQLVVHRNFLLCWSFN